jgi:hypothetical protein
MELLDGARQQQMCNRLEYQSNKYKLMMSRLNAHLTRAQQLALVQGGAHGLFACMEEEREEALPEIKRTRPKVGVSMRWNGLVFHWMNPALTRYSIV